jgi:hypothetical protein
MVVCALILVGALGHGCTAKQHWTVRSPTTWGDVLALLGGLLGFLGLELGWAVRSGPKALPDELRWYRDRRRGTVIVSALRPGPSLATLATDVHLVETGMLQPTLDVVGTGMQQLTCNLDIRVAGVPGTRGAYVGSVGPLDARKFVEGATLAWEANPSLPERVRIWPHADLKGGELTGSFLDFVPA